jgi:hypothetical protein
VSIRSKVFVAAIAATVLVAAGTAGSALGTVPPAPSSQADAFGFADISDGITPEDGFFLGEFEKGTEAYFGNDETTVVNFTLPEGVTFVFDPECNGLSNGDLCLVYETDCEPLADPAVTVDGNSVEFRLACEPGEQIFFQSLVDSLLPEGTFDASVEFKVGVTRRAKDATNMWQIRLPDVFFVPVPF